MFKSVVLFFFLKERESLNSNIVHSINQASDEWGIRCLRYEIKDIHVPPRVKESMQMQVGPTDGLVHRKTVVLDSWLLDDTDVIQLKPLRTWFNK